MSNFKMVQTFHDSFHMEVDRDITDDYNLMLLHLRKTLIEEEIKELMQELNKRPIDEIAVAKELADVLYVVYGLADAFSIPIDDVFKEVHRSNMSKLDEKGQPIYREDGKVLKGPNYQKPQLNDIVPQKGMA